MRITRKKKGKSSQNSPIQGTSNDIWGSTMHTLLKAVSHYDLSVLSMSVKGFTQKLDRVVVGWCEFYPAFFYLFKLWKVP